MVGFGAQVSGDNAGSTPAHLFARQFIGKPINNIATSAVWLKVATLAFGEVR